MRILIIILGFIICISCKDGNKSLTEHPILKASLNEKSVSLKDLFKEIVVIPLETTEESSFGYVEKVRVHNDTIYVFDSSFYSLFVFDKKGKYIDKICRIGQGPGEYLMIYDFLINDEDRVIEMLNPRGSIYKYGIDGTFIEEIDLPKPPMNYRNFEQLDKDHYVTWSSLIDNDEGALNVLTSDDCLVSGSYFSNSSLWGAFTRTVFYKYQDLVYYHESMTNKVYHIVSDGYQTAYEWDLGVEIVNPKRLVASSTRTINEDLMALGEDFREGRIPFCFDRQFQTDKYYYTSLRFGLAVRKSLFYNKLTGESLLFEKTKEGVKVDLLFATNEYAIGTLLYEQKDALRNIVSPEDAELLDRMKDDDNAWLVKFVF